VFVPGEEFDGPVEPVTARAPYPRAFQRPAGRAGQVAVVNDRGKPAPQGAVSIHVRRAVQKHHLASFHVTPSVV
jgi:hypothetical protein